MLAGLMGGIVVFRAWVATPKGRYDWEALALRIPVAGKIVRKAGLARFARSFALGMRSGVPVMQALSNSAQTVDNSYLARQASRHARGRRARRIGPARRDRRRAFSRRWCCRWSPSARNPARSTT
jgi:type II secretory pathway component PulF